MMRQTLHLVTRRDYGLLRAAMSEMIFPWADGAGEQPRAVRARAR